MSTVSEILEIKKKLEGELEIDPKSGLSIRQLAYFIYKSMYDPDFSYKGVPMRTAYHNGAFDEIAFTRAYKIQDKWKGIPK